MASRYEVAAGMVEGYVQQWGDNGGDYNVLIGILRDCHSAEETGAELRDLTDAIVERINEVYGPYPLDFAKLDAKERAEMEAVPPEPETESLAQPMLAIEEG